MLKIWIDRNHYTIWLPFTSSSCVSTLFIHTAHSFCTGVYMKPPSLVLESPAFSFVSFKPHLCIHSGYKWAPCSLLCVCVYWFNHSLITQLIILNCFYMTVCSTNKSEFELVFKSHLIRYFLAPVSDKDDDMQLTQH